MNKIIYFGILLKDYLSANWRGLYRIIKLSLLNNVSMPIAYYKYSVLIGLIAGLICLMRQRKLWQAFAVFACITYAMLVMSSTVLNRPVGIAYQYELQPFWSYRAIYHGDWGLLAEVFLNLLMLIPIGILLPIFTGFSFIESTLSGFAFSLIIELSQLVSKKGLFEFDDLFHNTLGCACGYMIFLLGAIIWEKASGHNEKTINNQA